MTEIEVEKLALMIISTNDQIDEYLKAATSSKVVREEAISDLKDVVVYLLTISSSSKYDDIMSILDKSFQKFKVSKSIQASTTIVMMICRFDSFECKIMEYCV